MLTDHIRWKRELAQIISDLQLSCAPPRAAEKDFVIEKSFLVSGFILRKMIEAGKISRETLSDRLHVRTWRSKHNEVGYLQLGKLPSGVDASAFASYRFEESKASESFSHGKLADVIVHSQSLLVRTRADGSVSDILVNSDRTRSSIYCIDLAKYCTFLSVVASEELASFGLIVDTHTKRSWPVSERKKS